MTPHGLYAYDPGGTTGWALFEVNEQASHAEATDWGEYELWRGVDVQIRSPFCQAVVYENIVARALDFNPVGLQVIGVIRYWCEQEAIRPTTQPNAMLRGIEKWGLYDLSAERSPHARDALMHGIVYLRKRGIATIKVDVHTSRTL